MLELQNISVFYGNIQALYDISITIQQGEIVTLIGANGAGKSTTLMTISGILSPRHGRLTFLDRQISGLMPDRIVQLGISQVPEGRHIFPALSVSENLDLGAFLRRDHAAIAADKAWLYGLFPILEKRRQQPGGTLSGGEQQMLAIARALMARPKLLLLDEPSMGLAPLIIKQIFEILIRLNNEHQTTIFLVEQNANLALRIAHRGYVLENGRVVLHGDAAGLRNNPVVQKAYLGM
ncbi:ABC transporter ATP-binding protein [Desulfobulbus oligotrophicus]|jgi:branched-chain amino acid transport system ATP-binding protein|uniref:ABC transporter ATP-binding protein n=1 Tax=Desulfobulbus oligotrophicus TaxID=1909699 RepID=A0A7T6ARE1_9BACT|nr:ABC transporter ATP-binding protein [Desulfobulbus oligotrophicus]MDY0390609.1 ABC transporter ATP-binding protein [Desulfobulbus oligotrophicus]QQG66457.1 ABC transporter ATP-binding protein [Desulfobulbus oligotrophicus]